MNTLLLRGQYKVTCVLYAEASYAALQAVDIESRENKEYLLNVYEDPYLKPYIRSFHDLRNCRQFREMFVWKDSLIVVFEYHQGFPIDRVFVKGAQLTWDFRLKAAQALFRQALLMSDMPPEISCAAMLSENVHIFMEEGTLDVNWLIRPLAQMNQRELVFLLSDQIRKILDIRWGAPRQEREFVRSLCLGNDHTVVEAYSRWAEAEPAIRAAYEALDKMGAVNRFLRLLLINLKDWVKTHF